MIQSIKQYLFNNKLFKRNYLINKRSRILFILKLLKMEWNSDKNFIQNQLDLQNNYILDLDENLNNIDYNTSNIQDNIQLYLNNNQNHFLYQNENNLNYNFLYNNIGYNLDNINNVSFRNPFLQKPENYILDNLNNDLEIPQNEKILQNNNNENSKEQKIKKHPFIVQQQHQQSMSTTSKGANSESISYNNEKESINNNVKKENYNGLSLKQRMKLKTAKTKKLLENKTKRTFEDECKENSDVENNETNEIIDNEINNNEINNNGINNNEIKNNKKNEISLKNLTPKEIKMYRNRISAQRSRDRQKKELCDLRTITKKLLEENENLRKEIIKRDNKINYIMQMICDKCREKLVKNFDENNNIDEYTDQITSSNILINKKKMALLMTGLLAVFCIFGVFMSPNLQKNNILRNLKEKNLNKEINNEEKRVNVPFLIEKDYTMRHQKELEKKIKINNTFENITDNSSNSSVSIDEDKTKNKNKNLMVPVSLFQNNNKFLNNINNKKNDETNFIESKNENNTKDDSKNSSHEITKNYPITVVNKEKENVNEGIIDEKKKIKNKEF